MSQTVESSKDEEKKVTIYLQPPFSTNRNNISCLECGSIFHHWWPVNPHISIADLKIKACVNHIVNKDMIL